MQNDIKFKKRLGQNFLRDRRIVERIVDCSGISKNDLVIEVGPGAGILTHELSRRSGNVIAYEVDKDLESVLSSNLSDCHNVEVIYNDFLESNVESDISKYKFNRLFFISNVPYYITTPILLKLVEGNLKYYKIVMMVQKEVGERFTSRPGSRSYSSITVLLNYFFDIKKEFIVNRNEFIPRPKVDSVVVSFTRKDNLLYLKNFNTFNKLVRDSFQFKRKNIKNNLSSYRLDIINSVLNKYGYDLTVRAEKLPVEVFVDISNNL